MKKFVIVCSVFCLILSFGINANAYHFVINNQSYSCTAAAAAGSDSDSDSGAFSAQASASVWEEVGGDLLFASADGRSSIALNIAINRLAADVETQIYANGGHYQYSSANAAANGSILFMVMPDHTEVGTVVQADFMAGSLASFGYGESFAISLGGTGMPYGSYSVSLPIGVPISLSFSMSQGISSFDMIHSIDEAGGFWLEVPYTPAPLPSSSFLMGSGLSLAAAFGYLRRKSR